VLTAAVGDAAPEAVVAGTLRRQDGGPGRFLASLAEVHVTGTTVDWAAVLPAGRPAELPTYAFQRQRYWPQARQAAAVPAAVPDGNGSEAEARFWAAVDGEDARGLARALALDERARLDQVLPVLASWRRRERDEATTAGWRYRVSWVPMASREPATLSGTWLVVAPPVPVGPVPVGPVPVGREHAGGELADGCVRAIAARGAEVTVIEAAPADSVREMLADRIGRAIAGTGAAGVSGVVSLLGLDELPTAGFEVVPRGLAGTLALLQALGDAGVEAPLWVLTRGAVAAGSDEAVASPAQAMVWGLGRVAGLEHPGRWGGLVDIPARWDERAGTQLCAVLAGCGEDQVAIRPAGAVARRLVRAAPRRGGRREWVPRDTVLLTGGTGEIGPHLTRWLARGGAARVVLTSRSGPEAARAAAVAAEAAEAGSEVAVVACDITERAGVSALLEWIAASGPRLSAVMHAAARIELSALDGTSVGELAAGLGAKAAGAAVLDQLTAGMDLDAFVLFSSIAGVWGSGFHGAYAAANAYLDGLVSRRRARGLPATSMAWGVWDTGADRGEGVVPDSLSPASLRRQGLTFLDPGRALAALGQVLADDETFLAVADVDWARFAPVYGAARSWRLLDEIPEVQALAAGNTEGSTGQPAGDAELVGRLAGAAPAEQERMVLEVVRAHAAAVLGHSSAEAVPPGRAFREMGFDSLTAVELRDRLQRATGLRLPSTAVFDYPTPSALAGFVRAVMTDNDLAAPPTVLAEIDKLESLLSAMATQDVESAKITTRLEAVMSKWKEARQKADAAGIAEKIQSSTDDEVFDFIGKEFGIS
jgi:NADP-dependent 3-hydroxy acid dehydrogenase YdfG/acyl carrier protein